tara:strand:- start:196 stop:714 length:519 start_codon:yes stop_codon:yes gene_type:complete
MRLVAASIFSNGGHEHVQQLNFVSYFSRKSVSELLRVLVQAVADSMEDHRKIFEHPPWQLVCHRIGDNVTVLVTDNEYPTSVSFELLQRLHNAPECVHRMLDECQEPYAISPLFRVKSQLNETMVIMHENVEQLIQRGHDIDELVARSENLSVQSQMFYKVAKKHNRCCELQ